MFGLTVCLCTMCVQCPQGQTRILVRSPGTRGRDGCEPPCGCLKLSLCPLPDQSVLLTAELFLQPLDLILFLNYLFIYFYFVWLVFCLHVCLCEGGSPGTGVTDSCELPCWCWELNLGPLEEQPGLLIAELPLQLPLIFFKFIYFYFMYELI